MSKKNQPGELSIEDTELDDEVTDVGVEHSLEDPIEQAKVRKRAVTALFLSTPPQSAPEEPEEPKEEKPPRPAVLAPIIDSASVATATSKTASMIATSSRTNWALLFGLLIFVMLSHVVCGTGVNSLNPNVDVDEHIEMAIYEPPPPPPPPEPEIEEEPLEPEPEKKKEKIPESKEKEIPVEPPPDQPPPPSNSEPEPSDEEPPPLVTGVSMESTTNSNSGFKVRVGNTAYGDPNKEKFVDPNAVKKYRGGKAKDFKPVRQSQVATEATIRKRPPTPRYPKQLKDEGITGKVRLKLLINAEGKVLGTKVIKGIHPVLDKLSRKAIKKALFNPCRDSSGKKVTCKQTYTFNWEIVD